MEFKISVSVQDKFGQLVAPSTLLVFETWGACRGVLAWWTPYLSVSCPPPQRSTAPILLLRHLYSITPQNRTAGDWRTKPLASLAVTWCRLRSAPSSASPRRHL